MICVPSNLQNNGVNMTTSTYDDKKCLREAHAAALKTPPEVITHTIADDTAVGEHGNSKAGQILYSTHSKPAPHPPGTSL